MTTPVPFAPTTMLRYGAGIVVGVMSLSVLFVIETFFSRSVFFTLLVAWLGFLWGLYVLLSKRISWKHHIGFLALATALSGMALLIVIESSLVRNGGAFILSIFLGLLYGWGMQGSDAAGHIKKPFRRFVVMLLTFDMFSVTTVFFALTAFFPQAGFFLFLTILSGMTSAWLSFLVWRLYYEAGVESLAIWSGIVGIVVTELVWVIHLLPFAYAFLGFLTTWLWYMLQMFARFHFSPRGIVWEKQIGFLVTNAVMYILLFVFFVRWV